MGGGPLVTNPSDSPAPNASSNTPSTGSTSSDTEQPSTSNTSPDLRDLQRSVGEILSSGDTLAAQHVAGLRVNYDADTTESDEWDEFIISRTTAGDYVVVVAGVTHTFTDAQLDNSSDPPVGYRFDDQSGEFLDRSFSSWMGPIADLPAEERPFAVLYSGTKISTPEELRGYVIVGNPTTDFSGLGGVTADYSGGRAIIDIYRATGYEGTATGRERFRGNASFTANFTNSTISGQLDNFDNGGENIVLTMPNTTFNARDGFNGNWGIPGV